MHFLYSTVSYVFPVVHLIFRCALEICVVLSAVTCYTFFDFLLRSAYAMKDLWRSWLPFLTDDVPEGLTRPIETARFELEHALLRLAPDWQITLKHRSDRR